MLRTYINETGAIYTNAWMVISGALTDYVSPTPGDLHPTGDTFMLGIWSDVLGPALVIRPTMASNPDPTLATMDAARAIIGSRSWPTVRWSSRIPGPNQFDE